jgi:hypothetical protein
MANLGLLGGSRQFQYRNDRAAALPVASRSISGGGPTMMIEQDAGPVTGNDRGLLP